MLLDRDNRAPLNHLLVGVAPLSNYLFSVYRGNNVFSEHVVTWGLFCAIEGLNVFPDFYEDCLGSTISHLDLFLL